MEISPEALEVVLSVWRGKIEAVSQAGDIRVLRNLLFPRFLTKVELGYDRARLWYAFPVEGHRGVVAQGMMTTEFAPGKRTRRHVETEPKGPSERDLRIYEMHKGGMTAREVGEVFGISESRVRAIYWKLRSHLGDGGDHHPKN